LAALHSRTDSFDVVVSVARTETFGQSYPVGLWSRQVDNFVRRGNPPFPAPVRRISTSKIRYRRLACGILFGFAAMQ
jgi:hypothetical protein